MISEAEIRRIAAVKRVDPMVIDLDYCLGWLINGLVKESTITSKLVFKGGTCLRKCYFEDYRFSEDIDFTAIQPLTLSELKDAIQSAVEWVYENDGPDFRIVPPRLEIVSDEYGKENYEARIYFSGGIEFHGSPRLIRMDITRDEIIVFPLKNLPIVHVYSDGQLLNNRITCYSLEEMLSEKTRALLGQRRFAISRDLYDIYYLLLEGIDTNTVKDSLDKKFSIKGMTVGSFKLDKFCARKEIFRKDWGRKLNYLVEPAITSFDQVWDHVEDYFRQILSN